jgi:ATP-dependent DNA helicase RecG
MEKLKENEQVELKKSTSEIKEAVIAVSAILNKHCKGTLYFGVKNDGTIAGQDISEKTIRDISRAIAENIEPKIYPEITSVRIRGRNCVRVNFYGTEQPYFAYGRAYMRVGDEDRKISAKELENMFIRKNAGKQLWDTAVCKEASLNDISAKKLRTVLKEAGLSYDGIENGLKKLKLLSGGKILNTAVALFGKKPQKFFPNMKLRGAVFGTDDTTVTLDMQDFEGDIFYLIKNAEEYILKNIHIGMKIEGLKRIDVPEVDREAFREAVINAFCHRDYNAYDSVNIAVFKDRLEIRSPGLLYGGLTIEKIKISMVSERRNELIADIFHRIHLVERWGRGIKLMISKEPDVNFKEIGRQFITVFKRKQVTPTITPTVTPTVDYRNLTGLEEKIMRVINENSKISLTQIAHNLGISRNTAIEYTNKLKKKKRLVRRGKTSSGYWKVV